MEVVRVVPALWGDSLLLAGLVEGLAGYVEGLVDAAEVVEVRPVMLLADTFIWMCRLPLK